MHINITDITIKDEGAEHIYKRVTIKFILAVDDTIKSWKKKFDEKEDKKCKYIVNSSTSSESY
jgi:hypothetical protein